MTTPQIVPPPPPAPPALPPRPRTDPLFEASQAFRAFFQELQEAFFERETLLVQIALALLCREHVLVTGPPGTAKSAVANSVLGRIVDERTGLPSLFSKQLSETTVQADLIGPVNFKTLTETGRTEYLTDEGMLGAIHAFLDEVFDGRDMLLRSILNVLHERELKHGRKITEGRLECAIMTSNRYLSEAVARSPELLLAFADRLSFICFVPKSFARSQSRGSMLQRGTAGQRPDLRARLTIQHLDTLQAAAEQVEVNAEVLEGIELLADKLERALLQHVVKLPDYVPTKSFSQRSVVKALWALKAWVVRDAVFHKPGRALVATAADLAGLRYFFLLGGPPPAETEALLKSAADPRERAQLEIIRLEHRAFDDALAEALKELPQSAGREASELKVTAHREAADEQARNFQGEATFAAASALCQQLVPGPRHPANRTALLSAADILVSATLQRARRGISGQGEGRGGSAVLGAYREVLELCRKVPELREGVPALIESTGNYCQQALEMIALSAESTEYDDALRLDGLVAMVRRIQDELEGVRTYLAALSLEEPALAARLLEQERQIRLRAAASLRRRTPSLFKNAPPVDGETLETLRADANRLAALEGMLTELSGTEQHLRKELLLPRAVAYAQGLIATARFTRLEELSALLSHAAQGLRREGLPPEQVFGQCREPLEERISVWVEEQTQGARVPAMAAARALTGEAYVDYRGAFTSESVDGELGAVSRLEALLSADPNARDMARRLRNGVAATELDRAAGRIRFLGQWLVAVMEQLPDPRAITQRAEANRAFAALVKSRLPLLTVKEGELLRIGSSLQAVGGLPGEPGERAQAIERELRKLSETFGHFSKTLLDARARS